MAYITKRGSSYGVRYTYQDEQGKNCNKWESFSTKEEATNRKKQIEHELAAGTFLIPSTMPDIVGNGCGQIYALFQPLYCKLHMVGQRERQIRVKWTFQFNACLIGDVRTGHYDGL